MSRPTLSAEKLREHIELIEDFGGPAKVARAINGRLRLNITTQAISNWKTRGIPHDYRGALVDLAQIKGRCRIPNDFFNVYTTDDE